MSIKERGRGKIITQLIRGVLRFVRIPQDGGGEGGGSQRKTCCPYRIRNTKEAEGSSKTRSSLDRARYEKQDPRWGGRGSLKKPGKKWDGGGEGEKDEAGEGPARYMCE